MPETGELVVDYLLGKRWKDDRDQEAAKREEERARARAAREAERAARQEERACARAAMDEVEFGLEDLFTEEEEDTKDAEEENADDQDPDNSLILKNIFVDATTEEREAAASQEATSDSLAAQGLPYPISPGCAIKRGSRKDQGSVYPPQLGNTVIPDAQLVLKDFHPNPRNVILEMDSPLIGPLWMQVSRDYCTALCSPLDTLTLGSAATSH